MIGRPDLDGRRFTPVVLHPGGDVSSATVFLFTQRGDLVWAAYAGGGVGHGHLIGIMDATGNLEVRFHHVTVDGRLKSGTGRSIVSRTSDGRIAYDRKLVVEHRRRRHRVLPDRGIRARTLAVENVSNTWTTLTSWRFRSGGAGPRRNRFPYRHPTATRADRWTMWKTG